MKNKTRSGGVVLLMSAGLACGALRFSAGPTFGITLGGVTEQAEPVFGGQVAATCDNGFSVELAVLTFTDKPEEERFGMAVTADQDITPVQLSVRYSRPLIAHRLGAFALVGIGWYFGEESRYWFTSDFPEEHLVQTGPLEVERNDAFGYHWGVGVEWSFTDRLSALLEYRYGIEDSDAHLSGLEARTSQGQIAIEAFERDFWDNEEMGLLRVGLNWLF